MQRYVFFMFCGLIFCCFSTVAAEDVLIICNQDVPVEQLNRQEIKDIFLGKNKLWDDKTKIIIVTLKDKNDQLPFLKKFIRKSSSQFKNYWRKMVFTGKGKIPKSFDTIEEMLAYVAKTKGAIGYVGSTILDEKVKVIKSE